MITSAIKAIVKSQDQDTMLGKLCWCEKQEWAGAREDQRNRKEETEQKEYTD